jgi:hypothetical protein
VRAKLKELVPEYTGAADSEEEPRAAASAAPITLGTVSAQA